MTSQDPPAVADPLDLLSAWLPGEPGVDGYVPEMSLATVGLDGFPDVRTVLLSRLSDAELFFHTDSRSRKVAQLDDGTAGGGVHHASGGSPADRRPG